MKPITVVICAYNRAKYLELALQSLIEQALSQEFFDVLVVDNNSSDDAKEVTERFTDRLPLKYVIEKNQGTSYVRNRGIKESNSEFIGYLEDDAKADKNWLKIAYGIIQEKSPDIFGGPIYTYYDTKKPKWFLDKYETRKQTDKAGYLAEDKFISGANMFLKKKIVDKIGFFDTGLGVINKKLLIGEETKLQVIANEKGVKRYYDPNLFVDHLVPEHKMKVFYRLKRILATGITYRRFSGENPNFIKSLLNWFLDLMTISVYVVKYPFRNRNEYPYWQNYFVERIIPKFFSAGIVFSYFKKD